MRVGPADQSFIHKDAQVEVATQESDQLLDRGSEVWLSWAEESLVLLPAP
jgi:hypothetical protein